MENNEIWAMCGECGTELKESDKLCPRCGSTKKAYKRKTLLGVGVKIVETRVTQKRRGYRDFMKKMISRWKRSRDPRLKGCVGEKVKEELVFDKEKNWKDHVVKDAKTEEILHDEPKPLNQQK
jgi:predicted amidophosphoribosyltransferase